MWQAPCQWWGASWLIPCWTIIVSFFHCDSFDKTRKDIRIIWILVKDSWKPRLFISSSRSVSLIIAFGVVPLSLLCTERKNSMTDSPSISNSKTYIKPLCKTETSPGSEFTQNVWVFSFYIADFLSHLGKWIKLIKIKAEYERFLHLEGRKTSKYHIFTLILQYVCH